MTATFKESETLELKRSTSEMKQAIVSIAAILNKHQKGELYFGVRDDGTVIGQQVGEKTIRDVSNKISSGIEPKIYPLVENVVINGKECIKVAFSGNEVPYFAFGRAYMRSADEDRQISAKELENIIVRKNKDKLRWDTQVCVKASIEDISPEKVKDFVKKAENEFVSVEETLETINVLMDSKITNAAVILFGKKPQKFFPNARLRCAVFGTTDTLVPIDMKDFEGDLFHLIERAEEYILEHINIGMRLEGLYRVDVPEIDKKAFREAIINAFCHRDYYEYDSVNIAVFKDRLEIRNPGGLYGGLTVAQITKKRVSRRRNEVIADIFHRVHFVERWGRGIELILSKEPETTFEVVADIFITTFPRKNLYSVNATINATINAHVKSPTKSPTKTRTIYEPFTTRCEPVCFYILSPD